jgi:hypothetical protein
MRHPSELRARDLEGDGTHLPLCLIGSDDHHKALLPLLHSGIRTVAINRARSALACLTVCEGQNQHGHAGLIGDDELVSLPLANIAARAAT